MSEHRRSGEKRTPRKELTENSASEGQKKHRSEVNKDSLQQKDNEMRSIILLGTYHSVVAGYIHTVFPGQAASKHHLKLAFSTKAHVGSLQCVASCPRYFVTGGTDEQLQVFSVARDGSGSVKEIGTVHPPSDVLCATFTGDLFASTNVGNKFLLCGCSSGELAIVRTRDWAPVAVLPIYSKPLISMDIHPGQNRSVLVVTVGADRYVAATDLINATVIGKHRVPVSDGTPISVSFCRVDESTNASFAVACTRGITLFNARTLTPARRIAIPKLRPDLELQSLCFNTFSDDTPSWLVSTEGGKIFCVYGPKSAANVENADIGAEEGQLSEVHCHTAQQSEGEQKKVEPNAGIGRIRGMYSTQKYFITADTAGLLRVWEPHAVAKSSRKVNEGEFEVANIEFVEKERVECGGRITTLAMVPI